MKKWGFLALLAVLSGAVTLGAYKVFFETPVHITKIEQSEGLQNYSRSTNLKPSQGSMFDFTEAAEKSLHAVVHVTSSAPGKAYYDPFAEFFFGRGEGRRQMPPSVSMGSGVIIRDDGYIVTNNHVIAGAKDVEIKLNNNEVYVAEVIGADPNTDIALLKIEANNLPYLPFSNSDEVRVGEWVLAVGNPFNLNSTVTAGIVSAKGRNINLINEEFAIESFIQTDAAVNPGNSGGALVDGSGGLIGINTAISTRTGTYEGYSFAVPSNIVQKVVEDLRTFGVVQRAFIGVQIREVDAALKAELDLELTDGVYVAGITDGGAAEDAGIKTGDVIIEVAHNPVRKMSELQEIIGRRRPGDNVHVRVNRKGKWMDFELVLKNQDGNASAVTRNASFAGTVLGVSMETLSKEEFDDYGISAGVKVTEVKTGKFQREGIQEGFAITQITINNRTSDVKKPEDIVELLAELKDTGVFIKGYYPGKRVRYYALGF